MFDVGFSELLVIGIVALVVIGPERLPRVARTLGHLLGRAQRYVNDVKSDINREMQLDELKRLQAQVAESARSLETSVRKEFDGVRNSVEAPAQALATEVDEAVKSVSSELQSAAQPQASVEQPPAADVLPRDPADKTPA